MHSAIQLKQFQLLPEQAPPMFVAIVALCNYAVWEKHDSLRSSGNRIEDQPSRERRIQKWSRAGA